MLGVSFAQTCCGSLGQYVDTSLHDCMLAYTYAFNDNWVVGCRANTRARIQFGIMLGSFWNKFGIILGRFWDYFETMLGSFWDHVGTIWEEFWDYVGISLR